MTIQERNASIIHNLTALGTPPFLSTKDFGKLFNLKPQTVRKNYCLNGHVYGVVPKKMPNKKLGWPTDNALEVLYGNQPTTQQ